MKFYTLSVTVCGNLLHSSVAKMENENDPQFVQIGGVVSVLDGIDQSVCSWLICEHYDQQLTMQ